MTTNTWTRRSLGSALVVAGLVLLIVAAAGAQQAPAARGQAAPAARGQQAPAPAAAPQAPKTGMTLTASSANVSGAGGAVKINILRWSTDEERNQLVVALTPPPPRGAAPAGAAPAGGGAAAGRGGAAGGRGGRGGAAAPAGPVDPIVTLTAAIGKAPSVGYVWTTASVGYSIKYAYRTASPDGGERIILVTDPRLGSFSPTEWKPVTASTTPEYEFSIVEIRLDSKGLGEGKATLNTKAIVDAEAKTIALDNYAAAVPVLKTVKKT